MTTSTHFVPGASLSEVDLADRTKRLGASDVPAVLGLDPYRSPLDVYLQKRGLVATFEGNEFTEWGLRIEPVIRKKFAELRSVDVTQPGVVIHRSEPWASCTPDGLCAPTESPYSPCPPQYGLEIKNKSARQSHKWGPSGTDQVPHEVAAQVHFSMLVTGIPRWAVAALFGGNEYREYDLTYDADIAATIMERCRAFWMNVEKGIEPAVDGSRSAAEYLKQKFIAHGDALRDATGAEDAMISSLRRVRDQMKGLEVEEATLKNRLMQAIGNDAGIVGRSGRITWKAPNGVLTSWKDVALALNPPKDLIEQHSHPQSRRFLPTFPKED